MFNYYEVDKHVDSALLFCFLTETTEFCSVNSTSPDLDSLTSDDYLKISCHFSYLAAAHWTLHMDCLPNILGQTKMINKTSETVVYMKSFNVTPDINGIVISCTVKFNSTGSEPRPGEAHNAPDDIQLWKSAPLQVQCKHQFILFEQSNLWRKASNSDL